MTRALKPCPFCGGEASQDKWGDDRDYFGCRSCDFWINGAENWNRRPSEGSAEPVLWVHPDALNSAALGVTCSPVKLGPSQIPLFTAPPADDARRLLERALSAMQMAVHFYESREGRPPDQTCHYEIRDIKEFLARSGK